MILRIHAGIEQDMLEGWLERGATANIEAEGYPLVGKIEGEGILRVGFQHLRGTI